jgi:O-antigen ligase
LAFVLVGLAAAWVAPDHGAAWLALRRMILAPAGLYLLWRLLPVNRRAAYWTVGGHNAAGVVVSLIGLAGYADGTVVIAGGVARLRSVYYSPNEAALLLVRLWPLAANLALATHGHRRWLMVVATGLMFLALALTFSRGAWLLGVPAGLLTLAILHHRWRIWPWIAVVTAGIGLVMFSRGGGTALRPEVWQAAWAMWRDHPWLGVGLDGFQWVYPRYMALSAWREPLLYHPHNLILEIGTWTGVLGLLAVLALAWVGARAWRQAMWLGPSPVLAGLAAGQVAGLAHGLVDAGFFLPHLAFLTMITLGVIAAHNTTSR